MKIAICAPEVVPFAKTGGLADVAGALPLALEALGHQAIIIMPRYKAAYDSKFKTQRVSADISFSTIGKDCRVYFIENDAYFNREGLYGDKNGDYKDNLERFAYYARRALRLLKEISFSRPSVCMSGGILPKAEKPDIIHCHDWQSALICAYLKTIYSGDIFYKDIKTVFTIHNIGYQGLFPREEFPKLGLDWGLFNMELLEFYGKVNLLKSGIASCDIVNTVSPTYSREIQSKEFGYGLEGVLKKRKADLFGILNGLDYSIWNPEDDRFIMQNYSAQDIHNKYKNKEDLQKTCKLPLKKDIPLFGIVSRLAEQKGFDILSAAIEEICDAGLQLIILGTGELKYHAILEDIAKRHPKVVSLQLKFDDTLAHKVYAGSDIFLMPSKYEPCGLGQMISLRYGTIPLVFKTGGLADTVTKDNGFLFDSYNKEDLMKTILGAIRAFKNRKRWLKMACRAMQYNFSWEESAGHYVRLYERAKGK